MWETCPVCKQKVEGEENRRGTAFKLNKHKKPNGVKCPGSGHKFKAPEEDHSMFGLKGGSVNCDQVDRVFRDMFNFESAVYEDPYCWNDFSKFLAAAQAAGLPVEANVHTGEYRVGEKTGIVRIDRLPLAFMTSLGRHLEERGWIGYDKGKFYLNNGPDHDKKKETWMDKATNQFVETMNRCTHRVPVQRVFNLATNRVEWETTSEVCIDCKTPVMMKERWREKADAPLEPRTLEEVLKTLTPAEYAMVKGGLLRPQHLTSAEIDLVMKPPRFTLDPELLRKAMGLLPSELNAMMQEVTKDMPPALAQAAMDQAASDINTMLNAEKDGKNPMDSELFKLLNGDPSKVGACGPLRPLNNPPREDLKGYEPRQPQAPLVTDEEIGKALDGLEEMLGWTRGAARADVWQKLEAAATVLRRLLGREQA